MKRRGRGKQGKVRGIVPGTVAEAFAAPRREVNGFSILIRGHSELNSRELMTALKVDMSRLDKRIDVKAADISISKMSVFQSEEVL